MLGPKFQAPKINRRSGGGVSVTSKRHAFREARTINLLLGGAADNNLQSMVAVFLAVNNNKGDGEQEVFISKNEIGSLESIERKEHSLNPESIESDYAERIEKWLSILNEIVDDLAELGNHIPAADIEYYTREELYEGLSPESRRSRGAGDIARVNLREYSDEERESVVAFIRENLDQSAEYIVP